MFLVLRFFYFLVKTKTKAKPPNINTDLSTLPNVFFIQSSSGGGFLNLSGKGGGGGIYPD